MIRCSAIGPSSEEFGEFVGDAVVLAVQDLDVGQVQQVLGDGSPPRSTSPTVSMSAGLWPTTNWISPSRRDNRRSASKLLTASTPRRSCFHDLVADVDPQVAGWPISRMARPHDDRQVERDADGFVAERLQPGQGQRLDRCGPVDGDGGVVVEQARQGAGDQLAEGVAQQPGLVEEVPGGRVAAVGRSVGRCGFVEQVPQGGMVVDAQGGVARPGSR